jgi:hypothetical protein
MGGEGKREGFASKNWKTRWMKEWERKVEQATQGRMMIVSSFKNDMIREMERCVRPTRITFLTREGKRKDIAGCGW